MQGTYRTVTQSGIIHVVHDSVIMKMLLRCTSLAGRGRPACQRVNPECKTLHTVSWDTVATVLFKVVVCWFPQRNSPVREEMS